LGAACWIARDDAQGRTAAGLVAAMLLYNIAVVSLLGYARIGPRLSGVGLWPGVIRTWRWRSGASGVCESHAKAGAAMNVSGGSCDEAVSELGFRCTLGPAAAARRLPPDQLDGPRRRSAPALTCRLRQPLSCRAGGADGGGVSRLSVRQSGRFGQVAAGLPEAVHALLRGRRLVLRDERLACVREAWDGNDRAAARRAMAG